MAERDPRPLAGRRGGSEVLTTSDVWYGGVSGRLLAAAVEGCGCRDAKVSRSTSPRPEETPACPTETRTSFHTSSLRCLTGHGIASCSHVCSTSAPHDFPAANSRLACHGNRTDAP